MKVRFNFNGLWEQLNNPTFNSIEFDAFKNDDFHAEDCPTGNLR